MLVYAPGWSLASQFWSYTPPQKVSFPAAKKMKIPHWKLFSWSNFFFENFGVCCLCGENFVTPFSTLAMIKGSLPTKSTTPDRLRCRARPSDDDFTVFLRRKSMKEKYFFRARHLVVIYTQNQAHSRISVTGGWVIAWQMLAKILFCSWRGELVVIIYKHAPSVFWRKRRFLYWKKRWPNSKLFLARRACIYM